MGWPYTSAVEGSEQKAAGDPGVTGVAGQRPTQLVSLSLGLALGALGALPAVLPGCDGFALLVWIACLAAGAGALLGAAGVDPLRFGAVAPALWAVALALVEGSQEQASLPSPAYGALAWTGFFFAGMAVGRCTGSGPTSAAALVLISVLLVGLPSRGGIAGEPWPPRAASALLDLSPYVFLGEASAVRDMAWHRSLYADVGTDRFQRSPWNSPWAGVGALAMGLCCAWAADRRRQRAQVR